MNQISRPSRLDPFRLHVGVEQAYAHSGWIRARQAVLAALEAGQVVALLGQPGAGKSLLLREVERRLAAAGRPARLVERGDALDPARLDGILLVDEAGGLADEALGALLEGGTPAVLAGLPGFAARLEGMPGVVVALEPLPAEEVAAYVAARLAETGRPADLFEPDAVAALARHARGLLRLVNALGRAALFLAEMEGAAQVASRHVEEADMMRRGLEADETPLTAATVPSATPPREATANPEPRDGNGPPSPPPGRIASLLARVENAEASPSREDARPAAPRRDASAELRRADANVAPGRRAADVALRRGDAATPGETTEPGTGAAPAEPMRPEAAPPHGLPPVDAQPGAGSAAAAPFAASLPGDVAGSIASDTATVRPPRPDDLADDAPAAPDADFLPAGDAARPVESRRAPIHLAPPMLVSRPARGHVRGIGVAALLAVALGAAAGWSAMAWLQPAPSSRMAEIQVAPAPAAHAPAATPPAEPRAEAAAPAAPVQPSGQPVGELPPPGPLPPIAAPPGATASAPGGRLDPVPPTSAPTSAPPRIARPATPGFREGAALETFGAFRGPVFNDTIGIGGRLNLAIRRVGPNGAVLVRFEASNGLVGSGELAGTLSPDGVLTASGTLMMGRNPFECDLSGTLSAERLIGSASFVRLGAERGRAASQSRFVLTRS